MDIPRSRFKGRQTRLAEFFVRKGPPPRLNLPVDVLLEVASYMRPIDLLNLARTSTSFHRILMSKQSCVAWRRSLRSVPDLPECPDDMSEPFYTALVFGSHCFACGADRAYAVDYALRVRLCEECYEEKWAGLLSSWTYW
ncbi:hypothetical protein C8Q76DRAFT_608452 [Earliella scabrosa]|nr:hypothetical protein C8Q76DRAFT_608452 [Earliella scabrosa]